jgi:hypothetical protein
VKIPEIRAIVAVGDAVRPYLPEISIDSVRKRNLGSPVPPAGGRKADKRI